MNKINRIFGLSVLLLSLSTLAADVEIVDVKKKYWNPINYLWQSLDTMLRDFDYGIIDFDIIPDLASAFGMRPYSPNED